MRTPDQAIKDKLWAMIEAHVREPVCMFVVYPGVKAKKGETKAQALLECMMTVCRDLYFQGLDRGYDMGYEVGGGPSDAH